MCVCVGGGGGGGGGDGGGAVTRAQYTCTELKLIPQTYKNFFFFFLSRRPVEYMAGMLHT